MKKIITSVGFVFMCLQMFSQTFTSELEYVDPDISWPWNWDVVSDQGKLVTVNENGTLNIKLNGVWEIIEVDPNTSDVEPRGVAVGENGTIWFTTTEHGLWSYNVDGELENFNASNSFLPVDNLRSIAIQNNIFWISTDGMGLIRHNFDTDETTHFTQAEYPDLKTDFNLDPYIDAADNVWFSNREFLTKISPSSEWTNEDMRFYISGGDVRDIHIVSESEIWLAMKGGVVLFDGTDYNVIIESQFDNYIQVLKDSKGDVWLSRTSTLNESGVTIIHNEQEYFFSADSNATIPSQVFEFVEHQDTIIAVGTIGNSIAKMVFDFPSSITETEEEFLKVFPNPAHTEITVDIEGTHGLSNWSLTDLQGKRVKEGNSVQGKIDISQLPTGVYLLSLKTSNGLISKKVIVADRQ
ncbi:MAG: T9SS type A sorting domain-containing protein [Bacteroidota bacterium]